MRNRQAASGARLLARIAIASLIAGVTGAQAQTISPDKLDFGAVPLGSTSTQIITLTAAEKAVNVSSIKASGDFSIAPESCDLKKGGNCAITVTFAPKRSDAAKAAINLVSNDDVAPKSIPLSGQGACSIGSDDWPYLPWVVVLYMLAFLIVRWHLVARPTRELLNAQIAAVTNRVEITAGNSAIAQTRAPQIKTLLTQAAGLVNRDLGRTFLDFLFWSRGYEIAAWNCVHEAEERSASIMPVEELRASLERAEAKLRDLNTRVSNALADDIKTALAVTPAPVGRWQALLSEALGIIYDATDTEFASLVSWHNKTVWLLLCALTLILVLSVVQKNSVFFILGAAGGLLSRLTRTLYRENVPTDYGASWTTLFLSPAVGALMGWCGILLIILGLKMQVLGQMMAVSWCNSTEPVAMGLAFLLGFSERFFDGILKQLEDRAQPQATNPSQPAATTPAVSTTPSPAQLPSPPAMAPPPLPSAAAVGGQRSAPGSTRIPKE